jgi:hypothetical protein
MVPFGQQTWPPRPILFSDWLLMLPAKFSLIWSRSFRGEDLFYSSQSETRIALGSHIC